MSKKLRVILSGGGTGGHIYPALAIGQAICTKWPGAEVMYVGTENGLESQIVPKTQFNFVAINLEGMPRKISLQLFRAAWKTLWGLIQARRIIREYKPDLVIGTGGYVCLPIVWAAVLLKIPAFIHEQNVWPGLTNRFLSGRVDKMMLSFPETYRHLSAKGRKRAVVTGLPVRKEIIETTRDMGLAHFGFLGTKFTLLSLGGSRGSQSINSAMLHVLKRFKQQIQIIHITGQDGYECFVRELADAGLDLEQYSNLVIRPYLHDIEYALACADLCVSRAGAAFLSEMTARGVPGVLIPYPYATENHQEHNAKMLVHRAAAIMIKDKDLTGQVLFEKINELLSDETLRRSMAQNSLETGDQQSISKILNVLNEYIA